MSSPLHTQNKGEWSEFFAFLKILATGRLRVLDEEDFLEHELRVVRIGKNSQIYVPNDSSIFRIVPGGTPAKPRLFRAGDMASVRGCVASLLGAIKNSAGTFAHAESELIAKQLNVLVKSDHSDGKGDLKFGFLRPDLGLPSTDHEVSVKSWLGGDPTLFNASSRGTRLVYKVKGVSEKLLVHLSIAKSKPKETLSVIKKAGGEVLFQNFASDVLAENLKALRAAEPIHRLILAHFYKTDPGRTFITGVVDLQDKSDQPVYRAAFREFLRAAALGMTSAAPWDLSMSASDNYLLVTKEGELFCVLGRNKVEDFLLKLTYVDTPSTTKYDYGYPYKAASGWELALNFQIRLAARR